MDAKKSVRTITIALGGLWLLDGILQFQPAMFTGAFVNGVIAPTLASQPAWAIAVIDLGIRLWNVSFFSSNLAAALIQLAIGALILTSVFISAKSGAMFLRAGLWLSVAWGLIVWMFGEGFGIIPTGSASFYTGAPGSALIYVVLAIFLLYYSDRPEVLPRWAGVVFLVGAAMNLTPMFWQPTMLSMLSMGAPATATSWLASLGAQGTIMGNLIAIDLLAAIGLFLVILPKNRAVAWTALAFLALVWWLGQGFGGLQTFPFGVATDPNTAPVLALALIPALMYTKNNVRQPSGDRA